MDLQQKDNTHYRQPRLCCLRAYSGTYTGYVLKRGTVTYVIVRACAPFSPVARLCTTLRPQTLWRGYDRVHARRHSQNSCGNPTHSPPSNTMASELIIENSGLLYKNVNPLSLTRSVNIDCPHAGKYRAACKAAYRLLRRSKYRACGARIFQLSPYIFGVKTYEK